MRVRSDHGFLVAEVVFSAAIFFFAFTTIMLLTTTSMMVANQAKQKSAMTNAVASYVEQVRTMPYNQIGNPGGDPAGLLGPTDLSVGGFDVAIVPTVAWYNDPSLTGSQDYKRVTLAVTCIAPGDNPRTLNMSTDLFVSVAGSGNNVVLTPPSVGFSSPPTSSGVPVLGGSNEPISVWARANGVGVNLTTVYVDCDGVPVRLSGGGSGQYSPNSDEFYQTLFWDTLATDANGTTITPDGMHTLKVEAWDTNSQQGFVTMAVMVDNHAPNAPTSVTMTDTSSGGSSGMAATWPACLDGLTSADHYLVSQYVQGSGATDPNSLGGWTQNPAEPVSTTGVSYSLTSVQPFSRYMSSVSALSAKGLSSSAVAGVGVTRPQITGTWVVEHPEHHWYTSQVTVTLQQPSFPWATISNVLYRSTSSSMAGATQVGSPTSEFVLSDSYSSSNPNWLPGYYYQVVSTVTPIGYPSDANAPVVVRSNVIGPAVTGPTPMSNVGW